jgi:small ligand-binding sensory domain FIST
VAVRVSVGVSEEPDPAEAYERAANEAARGLQAGCDLALVFASGAHLLHAASGVETVRESLAPRALIGCGAGGVVGAGREIEAGSGAVVWALEAPGSRVGAHHLEGEPAGGPAAITGLPDPPRLGEAVIVFADPYTFSAEALLARLNRERPGMPVLGGLASATTQSGSLLCDGEVHDSGAVIASLTGVGLVPCVSQGATPVGPEMTITAAEGNLIAELASRPALERLRDAIGELDAHEQMLAAQGLMLGVVIDENQPSYERGDFLVRPILGVEPESNAIALGERARVGQTVRLHVRDAATADEDLRAALRAQAEALGIDGAAGALLFTCNGRGSHMFDVPDHDATALEDALAAPAGGFFCAGEIGPVGGHNFLHGFTATIAVFPVDGGA